ncbi:MAG: NAD(P)-dependent oxidoreductase [Proteobacteria bacterium]|nr:NAD(P)-dependent oxidoreductase [Pseudomonadota bacterium]MBI3498682.1 NAD(P)-dependent oxidoreductase [Pseudomonadota bacterium]
MWGRARVGAEPKAVIKPPAPIGFIGLGNMGGPMARRLLGAGYFLHVLDRDERRVQALAKHQQVSAETTPAGLAGVVAAVIIMLPDGKIVSDVVLGKDGLVHGLKPGSIVVDMSSSDPVGTRALGRTLALHGIELVDAPVSGGVKRALDGSLSTMVGGDAAAIQRVQALLKPMAGQIFKTGPLGSGHAMKALNNLVSAAGLWIAAEALLVGGAFGLKPETMVDVWNASTGRNNSTENKFKQQILSGSFASGFSLGLMAKDLRTAASLAEEMGAFAPYTEACARLWSEAETALGGDADHTAAIKFLEARRSKRAGD